MNIITGGLDTAGLVIQGFNTGAATVTGFDFDLETWLTANVTTWPVFPNHIPQQINPALEVIPCLTYAQVGADPFNFLSNPSGLVFARYQIVGHSYNADDCVAMKETLRKKLHGFRGVMGATTVQLCNLKSVVATDDTPVPGSDNWTYHRGFEFLFVYSETVTTY